MLATRSSNTLPPSEGVKACTLSGNWAWSNSWLDRDLKARGCANPLVPSGPVGLRITSILKQKAKTNEVPLNIFLVKMQLTVDAGDYSLSLNPIFLKYCTCRYMFGPLFRHCTSVLHKTTWLWRWLPLWLSKRHVNNTKATLLLRTLLTRTIAFIDWFVHRPMNYRFF